ncbi:MAG TPA: DinB family protein [Acidimicrobiales bacterium]|jgi:hypothetical protein|nr:DinB family protein [Acidimicrobiales bacterium]
MISVEDYLFFVDEALEGMIAIVEELGDSLANRRPDVPGTNTPFVVLTHCLGVMAYWIGGGVAGRVIHRDRAGEFMAAGPVAELIEAARGARARLEEDLRQLAPTSPPRFPPGEGDAPQPYYRTQGGVLLHVYEELAQHRGQMEGCRDVLRAPWAHLVAQPGVGGS